MKSMKNSSVEEHLVCQKSYEDWFQTTLGRQLLAEQRTLVYEKCADAYGSHQIELAISHRLPVASNGNIPHRVAVVPRQEADMPDGVLAALPHELPLAQHSVDLVVMHHTLDYASFPHQTLREVSRSLKSGGHLLIIGFNPLSFWGVRKVFNRDGGAPWNGRFISSQRVVDWLELLNFEVDRTNYGFYKMPAQSWAYSHKPGMLEKLGRHFKLPLGAYYCVYAQKQVSAAIPIRPKWKTAKVIGMPVANGLSKNSLFVSDQLFHSRKKGLKSNQ